MTEVRVLPSREAWATAGADALAEALRAGLEERGQAAFAGAGGATPSPIYERLSGAALDWSHVTATLVDERWVGEDDPASNAGLLRRMLLQGPAGEADFLALAQPAPTVDRSALIAARMLDQRVARLDAILLGMGEDGHICSMFPESPTLKTLLDAGAKPTVLGVPAGRDGIAPPQERLSMNLAWLKDARRVVLALTGSAKRAVFEREAGGDPRRQPVAALIASGATLNVIWTEAVQ
jgi:6-phosphogluconolactonase